MHWLFGINLVNKSISMIYQITLLEVLKQNNQEELQCINNNNLFVGHGSLKFGVAMVTFYNGVVLHVRNM